MLFCLIITTYVPLVTAATNDTISKRNTPITTNNQTWTITKQDGDLRTLLTKWANNVGWQLDWQVDANYPIEFDWKISGTFTEAVNQVLEATQQTSVPLKAMMYNSNKVLKIVKNQ